MDTLKKAKTMAVREHLEDADFPALKKVMLLIDLLLNNFFDLKSGISDKTDV